VHATKEAPDWQVEFDAVAPDEQELQDAEPVQQHMPPQDPPPLPAITCFISDLLSTLLIPFRLSFSIFIFFCDLNKVLPKLRSGI
jgi:hypothetical protein